MKNNNSLAQSGFFWRNYGFTKKHLFGAAISSTTFQVSGMLLAVFAFDAPEENWLPLLLLAIFCLLVSCCILLSSILALLFFLGGSLIKRDIANDNQ